MGVAARLAAGRVVAAAAARDGAVAAVAVARRLDCVRLSDQLGRVAAVDAVDLLVAGARVLARRGVGDVRVAVGGAGLGEGARGAVVLGVGGAEGQRGQRGDVGPAHAVLGVPARTGAVRVILEPARTRADGAAGGVAGVGRVGVVVGGGREAVGAGAGGGGAVAGVVVGRVGVGKGAGGGAGGVVGAPGRRGAVVSRVHAAGEGDALELEGRRLGGGRGGQRVAAGGQGRGACDGGIRVAARARGRLGRVRLQSRGEEDAAQHDGQPVKQCNERRGRSAGRGRRVSRGRRAATTRRKETEARGRSAAGRRTCWRYMDGNRGSLRAGSLGGAGGRLAATQASWWAGSPMRAPAQLRSQRGSRAWRAGAPCREAAVLARTAWDSLAGAQRGTCQRAKWRVVTGGRRAGGGSGGRGSREADVVRPWTVGAGCWTVDAGCWMADAARCTLRRAGLSAHTGLSLLACISTAGSVTGGIRAMTLLGQLEPWPPWRLPCSRATDRARANLRQPLQVAVRGPRRQPECQVDSTAQRRPAQRRPAVLPNFHSCAAQGASWACVEQPCSAAPASPPVHHQHYQHTQYTTVQHEYLQPQCAPHNPHAKFLHPQNPQPHHHPPPTSPSPLPNPLGTPRPHQPNTQHEPQIRAAQP